MAMNKGERTRMEELEAAVALHWPTGAEPKPMTVEDIKANLTHTVPKVVGGWRSGQKVCIGYYINSYNAKITRGCSNGIGHNRDGIDGTTTQNPGCMYRTEQEAALALRWQLCRSYARELAALDKVIAGAA